MNYNSPFSLQSLLKEKGLQLTKRYGQNFLIEEKYRRAIVDSLDLEKDSIVWEIGPGIGALTSQIMLHPVRCVVFEIDRGFIPVLENEFGSHRGFSIVPGDFLKNWQKCNTLDSPDKIVGNLPYSSGSIMIGELVRNGIACERMVYTLQKEVADRIVAAPGTPEYSAFSMICQYGWAVRKLGIIPRNAFFPVPDVTSAYLVMNRIKTHSPFPRSVYDTFVNDLFLSRRKTLKNNVKQGKLARQFPLEKIYQACADSGIDLARRGETLSVEEATKACSLLTEKK